MEKKIKQTLLLKIPAGSASAKAPLGPTLGQYGIPIAEFCNRYNTLTSEYKSNILLKAKVKLYEDNTYEIDIQNPDAYFFIRSSLELETGMKKPGKINISEQQKNRMIITTQMLYEIAKIKYENDPLLKQRYSSVKPIYKALRGTLRSAGILLIPSSVI